MTRRPWDEWELEALRRFYSDHKTQDLATAIGRTECCVYNQAYKMGLRKSAAFLASARSGRVQRGKQHPRMRATQFQAGHTTWNKGRKGWKAGGRSAETRFKPGRPAHEARNYLPIGSLRITKDGALERKVTDDPTIVPARRWVSVSRLVWEAAHGPVPDGHLVVFKPGLATTVLPDITLHRLELVTRAENMRRNSYHTRYPKEIAQLVQLRGALVRQINKRNRQREEQDHRPA